MNFILSCPRSGSTWLAKTLNTIENVMAAEYRLLGDYFDIQKNKKNRVILRLTADAYIQSFLNHYAPFTNLDKKELTHLLSSAYLQFIRDFSIKISNKNIIIDKVTPYKGTFKKVLSQIDRYFPRAKLVHLVRDGRDVATSGIFDWLWREEQVLDRHLFYKEKIEGFSMTRFFDDQSLSNWSEYWIESITTLKNDQQPTLLVKYEDLIADQAYEIQKICDFLKVKTTKSEIELAVAKNTFIDLTGRERGLEDPYDKARIGIVGDWKRFFTKQDGEIFNRIAGDVLLEYHYVDAYSWYHNLPVQLN